MAGETEIDAALASGPLARRGVLGPEEQRRAAALIREVEADGIETIRVVFADQHGILRGKTIVARALRSAFAAGVGVPSTLLLKDTSHRTVFPVWSADPQSGAVPMRGANDVLMVPRAESFRRVPWSPQAGLLLADVVHRDGTPIGFSSRAVLQAAIDRLARQGLKAVMGLEVEFQLFAVVDPSLAHTDTTMPPRPPETRALTQGYQYLTETRYGEVEPILDRIRQSAEAMGLPVRSMEIEMGPSQFEFTFDPADPMTIAEMAVLFRTLVKEVAHREGLHASFMAKPKLANAPANGWHIHQSIIDAATGENRMTPDKDGALTEVASAWIAGLLAHAEASCLLTTPTVNGYKRYGPYQLAPNRIGWGHDNRGAMIRALLYPGDPASRVENRVSDTTANPYYALASQLLSGTDGLEQRQAAPAALATPYDAEAPKLPTSLIAAIEAFEAAPLYRETLGAEFVAYLARIKRAEWERYIQTISDWEQAEYFSTF